jgi:hypothetical protein
MQGGIFRLKHRTDRRPGLPREPVWSFYPKYALEIVRKHATLIRHALFLQKLRKRIEADPDRFAYTDLALTPVTDEETDRLEMFTHNDGARQAVAHARKVAELTAP